MTLRAVAAPALRAGVGAIRVSEVAGRAGEKFVSPREQRERIAFAAERDGVEIVKWVEELDVSGRWSLEKRHGMRDAVEFIEAGNAEVLMVAYFDRLVRSVTVKAEIVTRVEAAGGEVAAVDFGIITEKSAARWVSSTVLAVMNEYFARNIGEKTRSAREDAIARGVICFPMVPFGYRRGDDRRLEVAEAEREHVKEVFRLRAGGATVRACHDYLLEFGFDISYERVATMFSNRTYLGELHLGDIQNLAAHEAIVDRVTWQLAHDVKVKRGRRTREPRLLARLGVLVCESCRNPLYAAFKQQHGKDYPIYRCTGHGCEQPVGVAAPQVEQVVEETTRREAGKLRPGQASLRAEILEAEAAVEAAQAELDDTFALLKAGVKARELSARLLELQTAVDVARDRLARLIAAAGPEMLLRGDEDWNRLSFDDRRALIRARFRFIVVRPARVDGVWLRPRDRVRFEPFA